MKGFTDGPSEGEVPVILVAVEPRVYAGAIGAAIGRLRPGLDLRVVEPDDLAAEVPRLRPALVLCSRTSGREGREGGAWVEFYPYAETPKVRIRAGGRCSTLGDVDLKDLLRIVDSRGLWPAAADAEGLRHGRTRDAELGAVGI